MPASEQRVAELEARIDELEGNEWAREVTKELDACVASLIRELCNANNVPQGTFVDDCIINIIVQRNQARSERDGALAKLARAREALKPYVEWLSAVDEDEKRRAAEVYKELFSNNQS
jgi:hypothetical protein